MSETLFHHLKRAREAVAAGDSACALEFIEKFLSMAEGVDLDDAVRKQLQKQVEELHQLALAAQEGARLAMDQVRTIVEAARSLQTYDNIGTRKVTVTVAPVPRRY